MGGHFVIILSLSTMCRSYVLKLLTLERTYYSDSPNGVYGCVLGSPSSPYDILKTYYIS